MSQSTDIPKQESLDLKFRNEEELEATLALFPIENLDTTLLSHFTEAVVEELYSFAYAYYEKAMYNEAESLFRILTAARIRSSKFWKGLGATLQMVKKYEQAIEAYSWAAINDNKLEDPYIHFYAAECLYTLGQIKKGLLALKSARIVAKKSGKYKILISQIDLLHDTWKKKIRSKIV